MLLLFDIDGTLIRCGGAGRRALNIAAAELYGVQDGMANIRLAGGTDYAIIDQIFQAQFGRRPKSRSEAQEGVNCYLSHLKQALVSSADRFEVLPGVVRVLDRLQRQNSVLLGLATGNVKAGARIKLEHAQLWDRFEFGGFGCDAKTRTGLVDAALKRANAIAQARWGRPLNPEEIYVIGDTEFDVRSAHDLGLRSIGVRIGSLDQDALQREKPTFLIDSLEDSRFWSAIGLDPA